MSFPLFDPTVTVAFSSYRPEKIKLSDPDNDFLFAEIQARLLRTIHELAERGYKKFLSGMAAGFDLMAASAVILARNNYPEIELVCVVPFPEQSARFAPPDIGSIATANNTLRRVFFRCISPPERLSYCQLFRLSMLLRRPIGWNSLHRRARECERVGNHQSLLTIRKGMIRCFIHRFQYS